MFLVSVERPMIRNGLKWEKNMVNLSLTFLKLLPIALKTFFVHCCNVVFIIKTYYIFDIIYFKISLWFADKAFTFLEASVSSPNFASNVKGI